jgi:DNA (cytosine-5)-methyltransferase 1
MLFKVTNTTKKSSILANQFRKRNLSPKYYNKDHDMELFNFSKINNLAKVKTLDNQKNIYQILKSQRKTDYSVIELFAGAGGMALGFENAGLNHILLNEINKDACNTLKKNFPAVNVVCEDVKNLSFTSYKNKVDIIQAGFPCQAFSYAGQGKGFEDTRGTLFFEFARAVKEVMPKIAIGENVKGLLNHDQGRTLTTMLKTLTDLGYKAEYKILKSQYFDVPQKRERLVIFGIRKDLKANFIFPKENDYILTLGDAIKNCPPSEGASYPQKKKDILALIPEGGYWRDLPLELQKEYMQKSFYHTGGRTGIARRLSWSEPSLTLTCSPAQKQTERCHPSETRPLNIREYARIQTFPDNWDFQGSISAKYKQIGNAVPVNLGYHIATSLIEMLDNINSKQ